MPSMPFSSHAHAITRLRRLFRSLPALTIMMLLAGCVTATPVAYQGLASAPELRVAAAGKLPLLYRDAGVDLCRYGKVIIDPIIVYAGQDAQFGSASVEDRTTIAAYMQQTFTKAFATGQGIAAAPGPNTMRLHLTLTGIKRSTPVLSILSHVSPMGLVVNASLQATHRNGTFLGSVSYAAELYDSVSGRLLYAYATKEIPDALDATASVRPLDAAREGVRIGARHLKDKLSHIDGGEKSCQLYGSQTR